MAKITLEIKMNQCRICADCYVQGMKKGKKHCRSTFKPYKGGCKNFIPRGKKNAEDTV
jgi:hypothetical protein